MATEQPEQPEQPSQPTLVERWLEEQQQWQRTLLTYFDSMVKNEEFLTHLGNAMRGSLLAGKPYPVAQPTATTSEAAAPHSERLDQVLFTLHKIEGQLADLQMTLEALRQAKGKSKPRKRKARA